MPASKSNQPADPGPPLALPWILRISSYQQGKSRIAGHEDPIKLSSNESGFGPSPRALEAYHAAGATLHRYADGGQAELREAIAEVHGLEAPRIVCGNGSEELIGLAVRAYVGPGHELLLSRNHFVMCPIYGMAQNARIILAAEKDYRIDVDAVLERVGPDTRMVALANPNTPTGTYLAATELERLHQGLPSNVLLLLDSAYAEYVLADDYEAGAALARDTDNVIMTRTFSKIYGLAGLRIGWAYCPKPVIAALQRIRTPFNTNCAALAAAAAAVRDVAFIDEVRRHNARWLEVIRRELTALGLYVVPSVANFYLLDFQRRPGKSAGGAAAHLESRGIIPRPVGAEGSDEVLRITVGLDAENRAVLDALREYMAA